MLSVEHACENRWFSDEDAHELLILAAEQGKRFSSQPVPNTDARSFMSTISTIMSRFYPQMRMGWILGFLEVKPGYHTYAIDFLVSNDENYSPQEKIYLFVAKIDDIETSQCIITPSTVNFLLNGIRVEGRNNASMDAGPQIPTDVTHMLTFGPNLFQVVGQFNGNYIIAIAYIRMSSTLRPALQEYVPPHVAPLDSDSEIIEGPSQISLNCPLSLMRIRTPVKGGKCRHVQCFDFDSFVEINSTRPSWRCPYCNQYVCFTDIRIDQNMVKVLNEIGANVDDVLISADGSFKAVTESNNHANKRRRRNPPAEIIDLTQGHDETNSDFTSGNEDRNPISVNFQTQPHVRNLTINPNTNNTILRVEENLATSSGTSSAWPVSQINGSVSEPTPDSSLVLFTAVSPALNRKPEASNSGAHNQVSAPNFTHVQQFGNTNMSNWHWSLSRPGQVNSTPRPVQSIPAWGPPSVPQIRPRTCLNASVHGGPSSASRVSLALPSIPLQVPQIPSSSLQQHGGLQPGTSLNTLIHGGPSSASRISPALPLIPLQMPSSSLQQHVGSQPRASLNMLIHGVPFSASQISPALPLIPLHTHSSSLQQHVGSQPRTSLNTAIHGGPSSASRIPPALPLIQLQMPSSSLQQHVGSQPRPSLNTSIHGGPSSASRIPPTLPLIPLQMPSSSLQQHVGSQSRTSLNTAIHGGPSSACRFSPVPLIPLQVPRMPSSSLQQHVGSQNWGRSDNFFTSSQLAQQLSSLRSPTQLPIAPRVSSAHNIRRPRSTSQSPSLVRPSSHSLSRFPVNADLSSASERVQRATNPAEPSQAVIRLDGPAELQSEQNWRPTGRMCESLTGQAYSEALTQFLNPPPQPAVRSSSNTIEPPPGFSPQLRILLANNRNWRGLQAGPNSQPGPGSMAGSSGSIPERSFR